MAAAGLVQCGCCTLLLHSLGELLNSAVIKAVDATATAPDRSGWVTAVIPIESLEHAQAELLRLGAEAEIITPVGLRGRMTAVARSLAELYRSG